MIPIPLSETLIASVGACAPVYKSGQRGACINEMPCRGFGVTNDAGQPVCTCFGQLSGCADTERCDDRKLICVPDEEPPTERVGAR